jgi:cyclopropane-fatty-acyl-phospholipid synthase
VFDKLLDKVLTRAIRQGRLELAYADGRKMTFGEPQAGYPDIAIRFTDGKVPRHIVSDPRLGAGEAYMDGRIVIERGDVMQFVQLVQSNNRWEKKGRNLRPSRTKRWRNALITTTSAIRSTS